MDVHKRPLSGRAELLERFIEMNGINKMRIRGGSEKEAFAIEVQFN